MVDRLPAVPGLRSRLDPNAERNNISAGIANDEGGGGDALPIPNVAQKPCLAVRVTAEDAIVSLDGSGDTLADDRELAGRARDEQIARSDPAEFREVCDEKSWHCLLKLRNGLVQVYPWPELDKRLALGRDPADLAVCGEPRRRLGSEIDEMVGEEELAGSAFHETEAAKLPRRCWNAPRVLRVYHNASCAAEHVKPHATRGFLVARLGAHRSRRDESKQNGINWSFQLEPRWE